jgi:hypothetical protein
MRTVVLGWTPAQLDFKIDGCLPARALETAKPLGL